MRRSQLTDHLKQVPLFAACSGGDLKILARHLSEVEVPSGATLVAEGDQGDAFYVILEGEASVSTNGSRGASVVVAKLGPGAWFGELAVLDTAPRNATVTATTPLLVAVLGARVFRAVLRDVPALTEKLLAGMARRLRDADQVLNDVGGAKLGGSSSRGASPRKAATASAPPPRRPRRTARSAQSRAR